MPTYPHITCYQTVLYLSPSDFNKHHHQYSSIYDAYPCSVQMPRWCMCQHHKEHPLHYCIIWIAIILLLKLEWSRIIRSIPWLLMPWRLMSPGHHQPWYWVLGLKGTIFSTRKDLTGPKSHSAPNLTRIIWCNHHSWYLWSSSICDPAHSVDWYWNSIRTTSMA